MIFPHGAAREMKPRSKRYSHPVNFPVKFTVQRVPENVAGCWRVLWQKYLPHGFFNVFSDDACVGVISAHTYECDAHALRAHMHRAYTDAYTSYSMTMESVLLLCRLYLSIVFHTNKRKRSHLLLLSCQDSKSLLNYYAISRK